MDAPIDSGEVRQIIIITEGKPGSGISPVEAARKVYNEGIVVSAVGIVNPEGGTEGYGGSKEYCSEAGGGLWYYSDMKGLKHHSGDCSRYSLKNNRTDSVGSLKPLSEGDFSSGIPIKEKDNGFIENMAEVST